MTLDHLTDEIDSRAAGRWTFATRRQRRRLVALTIEALPESYEEAYRHSSDTLSFTIEQVRKLYRERYGFSPLLILAIEIIVKLVLAWWLSRGEHVEIANQIRAQGRVL